MRRQVKRDARQLGRQGGHGDVGEDAANDGDGIGGGKGGPRGVVLRQVVQHLQTHGTEGGHLQHGDDLGQHAGGHELGAHGGVKREVEGEDKHGGLQLRRRRVRCGGGRQLGGRGQEGHQLGRDGKRRHGVLVLLKHRQLAQEGGGQQQQRRVVAVQQRHQQAHHVALAHLALHLHVRRQVHEQRQAHKHERLLPPRQHPHLPPLLVNVHCPRRQRAQLDALGSLRFIHSTTATATTAPTTSATATAATLVAVTISIIHLAVFPALLLPIAAAVPPRPPVCLLRGSHRARCGGTRSSLCCRLLLRPLAGVRRPERRLARLVARRLQRRQARHALQVQPARRLPPVLQLHDAHGQVADARAHQRGMQLREARHAKKDLHEHQHQVGALAPVVAQRARQHAQQRRVIYKLGQVARLLGQRQQLLRALRLGCHVIVIQLFHVVIHVLNVHRALVTAIWLFILHLPALAIATAMCRRCRRTT